MKMNKSLKNTEMRKVRDDPNSLATLFAEQTAREKNSQIPNALSAWVEPRFEIVLVL